MKIEKIVEEIWDQKERETNAAEKIINATLEEFKKDIIKKGIPPDIAAMFYTPLFIGVIKALKAQSYSPFSIMMALNKIGKEVGFKKEMTEKDIKEM